jgi:hypothetical protein
MASDLQLLELQAATLFRHDAAGRIVANNEPDGERAPLLFLGRTRMGAVRRFRDDLPPGLVEEIERLLDRERGPEDPAAPPAAFAEVRAVLDRFAPVGRVWAGPAWRFPDRIEPPVGVVALGPEDGAPLRRHFPWLAEDVGRRQPVLVVIRDGVAVARCSSARLTDRAAEAGVDTIAAYRGRGFGGAVAAAWALAVRASGRVPLYSTSWDNEASRRVAAKLGLVQYGVDLSVFEAASSAAAGGS